MYIYIFDISQHVGGNGWIDIWKKIDYNGRMCIRTNMGPSREP